MIDKPKPDDGQAIDQNHKPMTPEQRAEYYQEHIIPKLVDVMTDCRDHGINVAAIFEFGECETPSATATLANKGSDPTTLFKMIYNMISNPHDRETLKTAIVNTDNTIEYQDPPEHLNP